jgi:hypothetical protein
MKKIIAFLTVLSLFLTTQVFAASKHSLERSVHIRGFHGHIKLTQLADDRVEVRVRTWRTTLDTVAGHDVFPLLVSGQRENFFFGRFGASKLPILIFAVSDPDRIQDSRAIGYQVTESGSLIGQQVVVDETVEHGHSDNVTSGRFALAAVDPELGAIYSIAYQDARFEGFFVSYEKLRIRQWEPSIGAFIETDQGFLRDRSGRLLQSTRFHSFSDKERSEIFTANLQSAKSWTLPKKAGPKIIPASAAK